MTTKTNPTPKPSKEPAQSSTSKDAGPWITPELKAKRIEVTLQELREVKSMLKSLEEKEKILKAELANAYMDGRMDHLRDEGNEYRFNYTGVSVVWSQGRGTREWQSEVQEELDKLQMQMDQVKLIAESRRQYVDIPGKRSWKVNLSKPL